MEERQLIKLEDWFKPQPISCLKIVTKDLNKLPARPLVKLPQALLFTDGNFLN